MEAEMTQDQYLKFITTIIRGIYAVKPAKIEVAAGDTMVVHMKCTFILPATKEDAIKYLIFKNFDGINFHPLVIIAEETVDEWTEAASNAKEDKDEKEG